MRARTTITCEGAWLDRWISFDARFGTIFRSEVWGTYVFEHVERLVLGGLFRSVKLRCDWLLVLRLTDAFGRISSPFYTVSIARANAWIGTVRSTKGILLGRRWRAWSEASVWACVVLEPVCRPDDLFLLYPFNNWYLVGRGLVLKRSRRYIAGRCCCCCLLDVGERYNA